jgi:hypothetical protein
MASVKFVTMMNDIRGLVKESDLDFVRLHAEPLSPGDFVPASPEISSSKFGGNVPPKTASAITTTLGVLGIALTACVVGFVIYKIRRESRK